MSDDLLALVVGGPLTGLRIPISPKLVDECAFVELEVEGKSSIFNVLHLSLDKEGDDARACVLSPRGHSASEVLLEALVWFPTVSERQLIADARASLGAEGG